MLNIVFKKYGAIDSIELPENGQRNVAYVTFASDASAYMAAFCMLRSTEFRVQTVDDFWRQPKVGKLPSIQQINENCLIAVLKQTEFISKLQLMDTSMQLRRLLVQHIFPQVRSLRLKFSKTHIAHFRKALRHVVVRTFKNC